MFVRPCLFAKSTHLPVFYRLSENNGEAPLQHVPRSWGCSAPISFFGVSTNRIERALYFQTAPSLVSGLSCHTQWPWGVSSSLNIIQVGVS